VTVLSVLAATVLVRAALRRWPRTTLAAVYLTITGMLTDSAMTGHWALVMFGAALLALPLALCTLPGWQAPDLTRSVR
jgi:hypothetical protein